MHIVIWDIVTESIWHALLGSALLVFAGVAGWAISRSQSLAPVRVVRWWTNRVLLPLLRTTSWFRRTTTIYANNMLILAGVMLVSSMSEAVILAVALIGVAMGIAIRTLQEHPWMESPDASAIDEKSVAGRVRWGMALNMLEPPAIALTIGMAMAREPLHLPEIQLWRTFALVVAPLMLAAACGESLWMGVTPGFGGEPRVDGAPEAPEDFNEDV
jgi:hypothetical protein